MWSYRALRQINLQGMTKCMLGRKIGKKIVENPAQVFASALTMGEVLVDWKVANVVISEGETRISQATTSR